MFGYLEHLNEQYDRDGDGELDWSEYHKKMDFMEEMGYFSDEAQADANEYEDYELDEFEDDGDFDFEDDF